MPFPSTVRRKPLRVRYSTEIYWQVPGEFTEEGGIGHNSLYKKEAADLFS